MAQFKRLEQLRSTQWASRADAEADLKASALKPVGSDYRLGEYKPGQWQLLERTDDDGSQAEPPLSTSKQRSAMARIKTVKAVAVTQLPERAARGVKKSPQKKAVDAGKAAKAKAKAQPEPVASPAEPRNDMTALSADNGPYSMRLADATAQHSVVADALAYSRKLGVRIAIIERGGNVVRIIDARLGGARPPRTAARGASVPRDTGKSATAAKLLFRKQGATKAEIVAVTEWSFGERYIRRLAATHQAEMETIKKDHWRLTKAAA